jgi:hypothetical protein
MARKGTGMRGWIVGIGATLNVYFIELKRKLFFACFAPLNTLKEIV